MERENRGWDIERCTSHHLDTLEIINCQVDFDILAASSPDMTHNNTYDFQAISESEYLSSKATSRPVWT
jgi:hypothetical protein